MNIITNTLPKKTVMEKTWSKKSLAKCIAPVALASLLSAGAYAGDNKEEMSDAWLDGKLDTVILLNRHLNPFEIETDVKDGVATINGEVDSSVEKSLVEELALSIEGIKKVDNNVEIVKSKDVKDDDDGALASLADSYITTAISTKLLLNTDINSTKIDVDTHDKAVTLSGTVDSNAEKQLVEKIAGNTLDVTSVRNKLVVKSKS